MGIFSAIRRPSLPSADALERMREEAESRNAQQTARLVEKHDRVNDRESRKVAQYFQQRIYTEIEQRAKAGLPPYSYPIWAVRAVHDPMRWGWATDMVLAKQVGGPMRLSQLMRDFDFQKMVEDRLREELASNRDHPLRLVDFERFDGGPGRGQSDWLITVARPGPRPAQSDTMTLAPPAAASTPLAEPPAPNVSPPSLEGDEVPSDGPPPRAVGFGGGPH